MILPPTRMLATGIADLDQQVLDWMGRAPAGVARYFGESEGTNDAGEPVIICEFVEVNPRTNESRNICHAKSTVDWVDAVRNCLGIALTLEPPSLDVALGIASLKALEALAVVKGLRR